MELRRYREGNVTVLEVAGNVKLGESARQLAAEMEQIFQETTGGLLLDVARIDYVDSTGIGELVGYLQKFTQAGRRIALLRPHQRLEALLKLTQLDRIFPIFWERDQALAFVSGEQGG
ncbi:MAG: STAS domain-containing protein [Thermoanaerobaculum sp.]|nr:STAS domain-containing protein [Thermoanaerobaculum sp.]MDW7968369.1 STAS domain-containing protein [Thermoanaerobaculum sp.]